MQVSVSNFEQHVRKAMPPPASYDQRAEIVAIIKQLKRVRAERETQVSREMLSPAGTTAVIPESVFVRLEQTLEELAGDDPMTPMPVGQELTLQQAASILNVSRQYVVQLLNEGRIRYQTVGRHRRIRLAELLAFKREREQARSAWTWLSQSSGVPKDSPSTAHRPGLFLRRLQRRQQLQDTRYASACLALLILMTERSTSHNLEPLHRSTAHEHQADHS